VRAVRVFVRNEAIERSSDGSTAARR